MGKATITGGGTDGLYTVSLDYGTAERTHQVAQINLWLVDVNAQLVTAQAALDAQQAIEDGYKDAVNAAIDDYVATQNAVTAAFDAVTAAQEAVDSLGDTAPPEDIAAAQAALDAANAALAVAQEGTAEALEAYTAAATALVEVKKNTAQFALPVDTLKNAQAQLAKDKARWQGLVLTETKSVWCADLTEDASGDVGTIEIPGENKVVVLVPGSGPEPQAYDGAAHGNLMAREIQTPAQVFFNAAILPGWQKFYPTFRRGTITGLDFDNDTANVTLFDDVSSAIGLGINQTATLTAVPVEYMQCDAQAFEVGDNCVVKFMGMNWDTPKVIGFCDHPKPCLPEFITVNFTTILTEPLPQTGTTPYIKQRGWNPVDLFWYAIDFIPAMPIRGMKRSFPIGSKVPSTPLPPGYSIVATSSSVAKIEGTQSNIFADPGLAAGSSGVVPYVSKFNGGLISTFIQTFGYSTETVKAYNSTAAPDVSGVFIENTSGTLSDVLTNANFKDFVAGQGAMPDVSITNGVKTFAYVFDSAGGSPSDYGGNWIKYKRG